MPTPSSRYPAASAPSKSSSSALAWYTLKIHAKPVLLLNIHGFYDKLLSFLNHCVAEGMLKPRNREILLVANTVEDALAQLFASTAP